MVLINLNVYQRKDVVRVYSGRLLIKLKVIDSHLFIFC